MASRQFMWMCECEICLEELHDCFFINCGVCENSLCESCYLRLTQKKCPFCRSSMVVEQQWMDRSRSTLFLNSELESVARENFWQAFVRNQGYAVICLFTLVPFEDREGICRIMETGYFDDALSNGGKCRNPDFADEYVHRQLEKIIINSNVY